MKVKFEELHRAAHSILTSLEVLYGPEVDIPFEEYWDTHAPERYDPYAPDQKLGLGELHDEWAVLCGLLAGDCDPIPWHLTCLSVVLRAVADSPWEVASQ